MAVIPVFVSSTFRDFHAERDELRASVLPVLNELVSEYGCRVELIDLRWGVDATDEDNRHARVLAVCLKEIDRARPLFVGLLGDRYGWVPDEHLLANAVREAVALEHTPNISVTALEFEHGALLRPFEESVFLEREIVGEAPAGWRDADTTRVDALKDRVRDRCEVHAYRAGCENGIADLADFVDCATRTIGERVVRRAQEIAGKHIDSVEAAESLFFEDRLQAFGGREELVAATLEQIRFGSGVCLFGESGAGKSAVWCAAVRELRASGTRVVAVPVGASPEVTTLRAVLLRVCWTLGVEVPQHLSVGELEDHTRVELASATPLVLAVDGIDQLPGQVRPTFIARLPAGVTVLITTTSQAQAQYAAATGISLTEVAVLHAEESRNAITAMGDAMGRSLPLPAVHHLTAESRTPLWLRLAVGELSALDAEDFASIDSAGDPLDEIARLVTSTVVDLPSSTALLLARIINRAKERFGESEVGTVLSLAAASRSGLRHNDLEELSGLNTLTVAGIRRAVAGLLVPRGEDGRLGYAHAAIRQYVTDHLVLEQSELHRILAEHFRQYDDDHVCQEDRLWHLFRDRGSSAASILNNIPADRSQGLTAVVLDSLSEPGLDVSFRGLDAAGIGFLAQMVLDFKSAMRAKERINLCTNIFSAAQRFGGSGELDETALRAIANSACCLADLPSAIGVDLQEDARAAFNFSGGLVARHPDSMAAHEAHALVAMWLAREVGPRDRERALAASRTGAAEWQWVCEREPSMRVKSWLQFALIECGGVEMHSGQLAAARACYERALPLAREMQQAQRARSMHNVNVVNALLGLGTVADEEENPEEGLRCYGEAAKLAKADYVEDPARGATEQLAQVSRIYGIALGKTSYQSESYQWLSYADALFQALLSGDPANAHWPFGVDAAARAAVAEVLQGRHEEAGARLERAIACAPDAGKARSLVSQKLIEGARSAAGADNHQAAAQLAAGVIHLITVAQPTPTGYQCVFLADALALQAHAQSQLGQRDDGAGLLRSSTEWRSRYLEDPAAREYTEQARKCGYTLVEMAYMCPGDQQASVVNEIVEHWMRYLGDDLGEGGHADEWLAKHLSTLALNVPEMATPVLSIAARYARHLVDSDPDNHDYRAALAGVADVAGVAAAKAGRIEAASEAWLQAASILGTVQSANESVIGMRRSVATNLHRVCSEPSLTSEQSNRCLAAAVILVKLNGAEFDLPS